MDVVHFQLKLSALSFLFFFSEGWVRESLLLELIQTSLMLNRYFLVAKKGHLKDANHRDADGYQICMGLE